MYIIAVVLIISTISFHTTTLAKSFANDEIKIQVNPFAKDLDSDGMHPNFIDGLKSAFQPRNNLELDTDFWINNGKKFIDQQLRKNVNKKTAKNIIFFLGDGMSIPTLAALRVYQGGEEQQFAFENFPNLGMSKTYSVDEQVADSACTSTAYLTGVKANAGTIGVNAKVPYAHCKAGLDKSTHTSSIAEWAMNAGKWAGLITTTRLTDASPSGAYGKIASREWETDTRILKDKCDPNEIDDLTEQLIDGKIGSQFRVLLGGGRKTYRNQTVRDEENDRGSRSDGKDLVERWLLKANANETRTYVWNTTDLLNVDASKTDYLLGLFESGDMKYHLDVVAKKEEHKEPSLLQMTAKAIDVLKKNPKGYFLFVEGAKIDLGHHATQAHYALDEAAEFSDAIEYARKATSEDDTIILVTADHAHTMSYSGYPGRGNDIFGDAGTSSIDKLPFKTLTYANGPSYKTHVEKPGSRVDVRTLNSSARDFRFPATAPADSESHGGDDVAVYVSGPYSHLFRGTFEQNYIPHALAYAACIGNGRKACDGQ